MHENENIEIEKFEPVRGVLHCASHDVIIAKITYILIALSVNITILLCIFVTLLANNSTYASMSANLATQAGSIKSLQELTKDHAAIVVLQVEINRRLEKLEGHMVHLR